MAEVIYDRIGEHNVLLTSVTVMELVRGCRSKRELAGLNRRLRPFSTIEIDETVSGLARVFMQEYYLAHNLGIPDALIGACSIAFKFPLYTLNKKDFRYLPGIILYDPY